MSIPKKKKKSYTSVCSHHISFLILNKHYSGEDRRSLLRLLNTLSTLGRRLRETVRTDRQTDTHAVATSVLQSQQASGIPYGMNLKK